MTGSTRFTLGNLLVNMTGPTEFFVEVIIKAFGVDDGHLQSVAASRGLMTGLAR